MIHYLTPQIWIDYNLRHVEVELVAAKAAVMSLQSIPYQKDWVESLQDMELKREIAGTSKIEGADFTEGEFDEAMREAPEDLFTRSQRQVHAAVKTYRWIAVVEDDRAIDDQLILEIHRNIVTGADDDRCPPGKIRGHDQNVNFGRPRHRGVEGGEECYEMFSKLVKALNNEYLEHDLLIQALAAHYHLASMHPFLEGNGRTARALEALALQRAGLRDTCFIAMSNYYYEEKNEYLDTLAAVRAGDHNLTPFLKFGLKGIEAQSRRLLTLVRKEVSKRLFKNMAVTCFTRLMSPRKKVIGERQLEILNILLDADSGVYLEEIVAKTTDYYGSLKSPRRALIRDLNHLINLHAISYHVIPDDQYVLSVDLDWPTKITESDFFKIMKEFPRAKAHSFLR